MSFNIYILNLLVSNVEFDSFHSFINFSILYKLFPIDSLSFIKIINIHLYVFLFHFVSAIIITYLLTIINILEGEL